MFFTNALFSKPLCSEPLAEKVEVNNSDEWVLIKSEDGINVYYSSYQEAPGSLGLKIKFENTLNKDVKVYWTLKKSSVHFFQKVELIIKPLGIYEVDKTTMMVPFNNSDSIEDFEIIFE